MNQGRTTSPGEKKIGPVPPDDLLIRIGVAPTLEPEERVRVFDAVGEAAYEDIMSAVEGMSRPLSVLDFGCGSGRVMRWFMQQDDIEVAGCDIHAPTIEWMRSAYPHGTRVYVSKPTPPLPEADASRDLIYCSSVFSHLPDWAPWLLEMRRILKPGGVLVASIHGRGLWPVGNAGARGVLWDEDRTGLLVENYGTDFDTGWGPAVYVSEWWVREHWGRALDIVRFEPTGFGLPRNRTTGQAWIVARRPEDDRGASCTVEDLQKPGDDPRELPAAIREQWLAYEEVGEVRGQEAEKERQMRAAGDAIRGNQDRADALEAENAELRRRLAEVLGSKSWRLTSALRQGGRRLKR